MINRTESTAHLEWGLRGLQACLPASDVVVVVDVLSFTTATTVAVSRGATIYPYDRHDASAAVFAAERGAQLAGRRVPGALSLSPASLQQIEAGARLVLPSPNGSALSLATQGRPTLAGCLRNARAVAAAAARLGRHVAVIAAGERWPDGSLRPGLEDLLGAGAILAALPGALSFDAQAAVAAFERLDGRLGAALDACASGQELIQAGWAEDVRLAAELDVSNVAPVLRNGAYHGARLAEA
jgi:2-phosphosulfolactate phosphatase